jgi:hypothetical protein
VVAICRRFFDDPCFVCMMEVGKPVADEGAIFLSNMLAIAGNQ